MTCDSVPFVHLRVHTAYSLCEGAVKISDLINICEQERFPAIAITDTNNMFGVFEFSVKCAEHGIQPITGSCINILFEKITAPIVLLCASELGYKNLMKLMTCYYFTNNRKGITLKNLQTFSKDLLVLSGGISGPAGVLLSTGQKDQAITLLKNLHNIFRNNFFIELSRCGENFERPAEEVFVNFALEEDIPLVATNDVFFTNKNMHLAHDALLCIANSTYLNIKERRKVTTEHYLKSSNDMKVLFQDIPEAYINTSLIAKKCHFMPEKKKPVLPNFTNKINPNTDTNESYEIDDSNNQNNESYKITDSNNQCNSQTHSVANIDIYPNNKCSNKPEDINTSDNTCSNKQEKSDKNINEMRQNANCNKDPYLSSDKNTNEIAQITSYSRDPYLSNGNYTEDDILERYARNGLVQRLEIVKKYKNIDNFNLVRNIYQNRLDFELKIIKSMGFSGYFLIVSDFVRWSKNNNIPVGPGRGSGAGSIIAWCLNITELDPIKYNLLFERFLNPARISMPDFDIDFCQYRREETIKYVQQKYGTNKVAHIIALGKLQARNTVRDVGRVMQMPYGQVDKITKLIPQNPTSPIDLKQALELEPKLQELMAQDAQVKFLIDTSMQLEGLYRHASMHAAGIVIGNNNIDEIVPTYSDGESDMPITQFNMKYVEMASLVKFDFLGLKTLTVIQETINNIKKYRNITVDINNIDMEDTKTFKLLCDVDVIGVFQLESAGIRDVLKQLQPDNIEDIIALISLYRPGPIDNIPIYLARKHGKEKIEYIHPILEPILKSTYGIMIYQEQVMQIAQQMGGYSLAGADLLRRAMGKKIKQEMEKNRDIFQEGAQKKGISKKIALQVFDLMEKFASYGFNRSHAAAYGVISYQTAYLKANFRLEFYIASLNLDIDNADKRGMFMQDAKQAGIKILPPDINLSEEYFIRDIKSQTMHDKNEWNYTGDIDRTDKESNTITSTTNTVNGIENTDQNTTSNEIRFALGALKGGGIAVMKSIVEDRKKNGPFIDIFDFFKRASTIHGFNAKQAEVLILSGALDSIHKNRRQIFESYKSLLEFYTNQTQSRQFLLFQEDQQLQLKQIEDWPILEKLSYEGQVVQSYLNRHPLELYTDILQKYNVVNSAHFKNTTGIINIAGLLVGKDEHLSKKSGQKFSFIALSDTSNTYELSLFPELYSKTKDILKIGCVYILQVQIKSSDRINVISIRNLDDIIKNQNIFIYIEENTDINALKSSLLALPNGNNHIYFLAKNEYGQKLEIDTKISKDLNIENRKNLIDKLGINIEF